MRSRRQNVVIGTRKIKAIQELHICEHIQALSGLFQANLEPCVPCYIQNTSIIRIWVMLRIRAYLVLWCIKKTEIFKTLVQAWILATDIGKRPTKNYSNKKVISSESSFIADIAVWRELKKTFYKLPMSSITFGKLGLSYSCFTGVSV